MEGEYKVYFEKSDSPKHVGETLRNLIKHPEIKVIFMCFRGLRLGKKEDKIIRKYIETTTSLQVLIISGECGSTNTLCQVGRALRKNNSLTCIETFAKDFSGSRKKVEAAFVDALIKNPERPPESTWFVLCGDPNFNAIPTDDLPRLRLRASAARK
ncbi:MAG: hypothetical protein ACOVQN_04120 [Exiguobacterium sp.]|jgi:hypothetical protein